MKAVVYHGVGDIRLDEMPEPRLQADTDAVVRISTAAICGTDLHAVRGTQPGMEPGTIMGHEGVGIVEEMGRQVRNFNYGDRVVIASTVACGYCSYCRAGYYSQCDNANPHGKRAGTVYFGGPRETGPLNGLQAERARIPFANIGMVKIPDSVTDEQAVVLSDIFPTGYFGAENAEIKPGDTVAVFGCGPVGQCAIASAKLFDAGRVFAIDNQPDRLEMARAQGAEVINFDADHPVQSILDLTGGIGVDRAVDAVGIDSDRPHGGPAAGESEQQAKKLNHPLEELGIKTDGKRTPYQSVFWATQALAKAGSLSIIGVYPQNFYFFPLGEAMGKNLTINMGNCSHRKYIPMLLDMVESNTIDPSALLTREESLDSVVSAYRSFESRQPGWIKVAMVPANGS